MLEGSPTTGLLHQAPASSQLGQLFAVAQDPETPLLRPGDGVNPARSDTPSSSARPVITEVTEGVGATQAAAADVGQPNGGQLAGRELVVVAPSGVAADNDEVMVTGSRPAPAVLMSGAILDGGKPFPFTRFPFFHPTCFSVAHLLS